MTRTSAAEIMDSIVANGLITDDPSQISEETALVKDITEVHAAIEADIENGIDFDDDSRDEDMIGFLERHGIDWK